MSKKLPAVGGIFAVVLVAVGLTSCGADDIDEDDCTTRVVYSEETGDPEYTEDCSHRSVYGGGRRSYGK